MEDLATVMVRFDSGAKGCFSVGQVCAGHKNDLVIEACGTKGSLRWHQERQNELWLGHRDRSHLQTPLAIHAASVAGARPSSRHPAPP